MLSVRRSTWAVVAALALVSTAPASVAPAKRAPSDVWRHTVAASGTDLFPTAAASAPDGSVWLAGTSSPAGAKGDPGTFWLWRVDRDGKRIFEGRIPNPAGEVRINPAYVYIPVLERTKNGLLLVVEFEPRRPTLVLMSERGEVQKTVELAPPGVPTQLRRAVAAGADEIWLLGQQWTDAFAVRVNGDGEISFSERYDLGAQDLFLDAVPVGGDLVVVANSGQYGMFATGPSKVSLHRLTDDGELDLRVGMPGRYGRIARGPGGSFAVAYDRSDTSAQDVWLDGFDPALRPTWSTPLVESRMGLEQFKLVRLPERGFLVVGAQDQRLWVSERGATGDEIWSHLDDRQTLWVSDPPLVSDQGAFVSFSVLDANLSYGLARQVGLLRVGLTPESNG